MLEIPVGRRAAIALQTPLALPVGRRVRVRLGPVDTGPPPTPVEVVGDVVSARTARWGGRIERQRTWSDNWQPMLGLQTARGLGWGGKVATRAAATAAWATGTPVAHVSLPIWGGKFRIERDVVLATRTPLLRASGVQAAWSGAMASALRASRAAWRAPATIEDGLDSLWRASTGGVLQARRMRWRVPPLQHRPMRIPWGRGNGLEWVVRPPVPRPEPQPQPPPNGRQAALRFFCREYTHPSMRVPLRFGQPACYAARPTQRAYVVLNTISVVRLPDRLPIHVDAVGVAGSCDSPYWEANLTLADPEQLAALQPTAHGPRQVEISINGYTWVISLESFDRSRVYGQTDVSLRGRSPTALLSEPYAPPRSLEVGEARTMVQLADLEVDGSGIEVDYGTVSWLVPAGAWYYESLTPMAALMRIAEASGAVVQSHPSLPTVQIRPRFPASPWAWTTTAPDVVVQDDIVTGMRLQLQSRPMYDAVIVAGEHVGVAAKVKREGEAGQTFAPQQVDQLITHADGARERGRNVLGDRGGQASIEHDLPLFAAPLQTGQPGLLLPLMIARRVSQEGTWHGLVTAVRIDARRQAKAIDVVQTATIERHYSDAD